MEMIKSIPEDPTGSKAKRFQGIQGRSKKALYIERAKQAAKRTI